MLDAAVEQKAVSNYSIGFQVFYISGLSGTKSIENNENMIDIDDHLLLKRNKKDFDIALYRFQRMEKKQEKLQNLRSQFEKDKEKIRIMKENRKFKPY